MAVKFSEFPIGAINADLEIVGFNSATPANVQVSYTDIKTDILASAIKGTVEIGQVPFGSATNTISGTNNLFWNSANNRLGIGTNSPARILDISAAGNSPQVIRITNTTNNTAASSGIEITSGGVTGSLFMTSPLYSGFGALTSGSLGFYTAAAGANIVMAVNSSGYFAIGTGAVTPTEKFRLTNIGNLILQNGGTFVDAGYRLQVQGTTFLNGGTFIVGNLNVNNIVGYSGSVIIEPGGSFSTVTLKTFGTSSSFVRINSTSTFNHTSGDVFSMIFDQAYAPTSGTGTQTYLTINPTINQTGGANGITRGLYVQPTLTAAADWRAIEVSAGVSVFAPSSTASATLRIPSGTAPTSPVNGDIWSNGTNLFMRIGGVTKTFTLV